jgi:hypothetical protein
MFGSFLPGLWLVGTTKVYPGVGADIVMESILQGTRVPKPFLSDTLRRTSPNCASPVFQGVPKTFLQKMRFTLVEPKRTRHQFVTKTRPFQGCFCGL